MVNEPILYILEYDENHMINSCGILFYIHLPTLFNHLFFLFVIYKKKPVGCYEVNVGGEFIFVNSFTCGYEGKNIYLRDLNINSLRL